MSNLIKKPEHKTNMGYDNWGRMCLTPTNIAFERGEVRGYNQACDEWQVFHTQEMLEIKELKRLNKLLEEEVNAYIKGDEDGKS